MSHFLGVCALQKRGFDVEHTLDTDWLLDHPKVSNLLDKEVKGMSGQLKSFDRYVACRVSVSCCKRMTDQSDPRALSRPKNWTMVKEPFTVENGLLTPKMSKRRNRIDALYKDQLDHLYTKRNVFDD